MTDTDPDASLRPAMPPSAMAPSTTTSSAMTPPMRRALGGLLLLALALRVVAAIQPGYHHPDAIFQYLEPAFRLISGEGVVTWEWRVGMRSWLLPALLAGPVALGEAIDARSSLPLILPRIAMALGSLGIVWAAFEHGRRHSDTAALLAGFVAATWFEFIYFGAQTLSEPLATAAFLVASVPLAARAPSAKGVAGAGALLVLTVLLRPHYAPAGLVLVGFALWPARRSGRRLAALLLPMLAGGAVIALASAVIDLSAGTTPFVWIIENVRQNVVHNVAARYGVSSGWTFVFWFLALWSWWLVPVGIGLRFGARHAPALVVASIVTIMLHSLIGHKEYRFIFLAVAALLIVSAIGWGVLLDRAAATWPARRALIARCVVVAGWSAASILLAQTSLAQFQRRIGVPGSELYAMLRADPAVCGVAIVYGAAFVDVPGQVGLGRAIPQYGFWGPTPARRGAQSWALAAQHRHAFNRIIGSVPRTGSPPPGYRTVRCDTGSDGYGMCLYARPGRCTPAGSARFGINHVLVAIGA